MYGQDPYVTKSSPFYLLCESIEEERIAISLMDSLECPERLDTTVVWDNPTERQVWAPELHFINGLWYIYYTASDGDNCNHRTYVLQAPHYYGPYLDLGMVGPDIWGIDMTIFDWWDGNKYTVWSGWNKNNDEFPQNLYIAIMETPWRIGERTQLAVPEYAWEKSIAPILEGPQVWMHDGLLSILYSANASWKQEYSTGVLTMVGGNPMNPQHWVKRTTPLFQNAGHGCVIDGYFVYHRKLSAFPGWNDREIVSTQMK